MARHIYRIVMQFTTHGGHEGKLDGTVNAKTRIGPQLAADREWLLRKGHVETALLIVRDDGHVLYNSEPRQETMNERGLANADSAHTQLKAWR